MTRNREFAKLKVVVLAHMSLDKLFYPKSVALIGASKEDGSVGNEIAKNLATQGYKGKLYFVNPKRGKLYGKKILTDPHEIKPPLDLAIIAIPAKFVLDELKALLPLKVKSAVVISAGFKEAGEESAEIELARICTDNGIALLGPNCLGFLNPEIKLNASFAPLMPQIGNIAFVSQSGALLASVLDCAAREKIGFSKVISVGNKAQLGEAELLKYLHEDPKTKIIAIYLEELEEANLVRKIATTITQGKQNKPIIAIKAGRTTEGKKAALSHTGSLGGSDEAYEALFRGSGIIRADSIEEMFDIIEIFQRSKKLKAKNVAIITNAGGPGVLTADAIVSKGLNLAQLSAETQAKLKKFLPNSASVKNPIDILGDADSKRYEQTLDLIVEDKNVDAVQVILTPQSTTEVEKTAKAIVKINKKTQKPIVTTFMGQELVEGGVDILNKNKVATTLFPEDSGSALSALNFFANWQKTKNQKPIRIKGVNNKKVHDILSSNIAQQGKLLPFEQSFEILKAYKIPTIQRWVATNQKEAQDLESKLTGLVVLRIISPDIVHKSDIGGVILSVKPKNIRSEYEKLVTKIHKKLPKAKITGVDVSPMVPSGGLELIIGAKTDPTLGKQILVGLGGIYAEVIRDTSWGLAPLTRNDINRMIASLKIAKILAGYRGKPPLDTAKVKGCLASISQLVTDFPQIGEIDINPLIVKKDSATAVDARIVML